MDGFQSVDFYRVEDLLTAEELSIRDRVRAWVSERVVPIAAGHFEEGTFPGRLVPELADLGLLGGNLPQSSGCAGMSNVAYGLAMQELERGDSAIRTFASVQGALVMHPIHAFGSEEQKSFWLPRLARGETIGCFGLTEPDHGSDPSGMTTQAVKQGDRWILNGRKSWITNGSIADVGLVWAKAEGKVRGFLVEAGTAGFTAPEIRHKLSLRASVTSELVLEDCAVPDDSVLPAAEGLKSALLCLDQARYGVAWGALGAAMACYDTALRYAGTRVQYRRPIAGFQLIQEKLVTMLTEITKAQLLALQLGRLKDAGKLHFAQVSLAKRNNVAIAVECARLARDILGANGISLEYPVMRHLCNLESVRTYEGTHDIHTLIVGQAITGLPAFR